MFHVKVFHDQGILRDFITSCINTNIIFYRMNKVGPFCLLHIDIKDTLGLFDDIYYK